MDFFIGLQLLSWVRISSHLLETTWLLQGADSAGSLQGEGIPPLIFDANQEYQQQTQNN